MRSTVLKCAGFPLRLAELCVNDKNVPVPGAGTGTFFVEPDEVRAARRSGVDRGVGKAL